MTVVEGVKGMLMGLGLVVVAFGLVIGILVANDIVRNEYSKWRKYL